MLDSDIYHNSFLLATHTDLALCLFVIVTHLFLRILIFKLLCDILCCCCLLYYFFWWFVFFIVFIRPIQNKVIMWWANVEDLYVYYPTEEIEVYFWMRNVPNSNITTTTTNRNQNIRNEIHSNDETRTNAKRMCNGYLVELIHYVCVDLWYVRANCRCNAWYIHQSWHISFIVIPCTYTHMDTHSYAENHKNIHSNIDGKFEALNNYGHEHRHTKLPTDYAFWLWLV